MVFLDKGYGNKSFCGTRMPWTVIIPFDKLTLVLTIKKCRQYEFSMFYGSVQKNWIIRLLYIIRLLKPLNWAISKVIHRNKINAQYYIVIRYDQYISLNILYGGLVNGSVTVKDGPGHLSNHIAMIDSDNSSRTIRSQNQHFGRLFKFSHSPTAI